MTTDSFASVLPLVLDTERIATVHRRLALAAQASLPLILLAPLVEMPVMEQSLQWHKYRTQDPGLIWLRQLMHRRGARLVPTIEHDKKDAVSALRGSSPSH